MSFDALAPHYRWMEVVLAGNKLQRCRTAFLDPVIRADEILILGEGNGRFLAECRRRIPSAQITVVDASARMLTEARRRLSRAGLDDGNLEFVHADALKWTPAESRFDLIVTHFFLDCFSPAQLERVVGALSRAARREATWLLADFQVPARGIRRYRARMIHALMYVFFRTVTGLSARAVTPPDETFHRHGFRLEERRTSEWGLLHSDLWRRNADCEAKT